MKKQAVILIGLTLALAAYSTVSAQILVQADASASAETNSGGGLGKGLNYMVKSILGDTGQSEPASAQSAPVPAAAMMMQVNTAADARLAPQPETMSLKSAMTAFNADAAIEPVTEESLHAYILELMREDSHIQSVDTSDTHVRVTYAVPAKVLGFVRVVLKITAGAYASGKTDVSYPWYSFAASRAAPELQTRLTEQVEPLISSESFTLEEQQTLIDAIHIALAGEFESSTGGDR